MTISATSSAQTTAPASRVPPWPVGRRPTMAFVFAAQPTAVSFFNPGLMFAQLDGTFQDVGGSEPAFGLASGSVYSDPSLVMIRSNTANSNGIDDVWSAAYAGGACSAASMTTETAACAAVGKVSYLGGHQYSTTLPISTNPQTQGTRLFLQSLFEAGSIQSTTTTSVSSSTNPSIFGQSVTLTATVTPLNGSGTPSGTVNFYDGTTTIGSG